VKLSRRRLFAVAATAPIAVVVPATEPLGTWVTFSPIPVSPEVLWLAKQMRLAMAEHLQIPLHILEGRAEP